MPDVESIRLIQVFPNLQHIGFNEIGIDSLARISKEFPGSFFFRHDNDIIEGNAEIFNLSDKGIDYIP